MMVWIDTVFGPLVYLSAVAFGVLAIGTIAVRLTTQPIERIRIIQCTLLAIFAAAALGQVSIVPRWNLGLLDRSPQVIIDVGLSTGLQNGDANGDSPIVRDDPDLAGEFLDASKNVSVDRAPIESAVKGTTSNFWGFVSWPNLQDTGRVLCVFAFAVATLFFTLEWLVGMLRLWQMTRTATQAQGTLTTLWQSVTGNQEQSVRLLVTDQIETPLTFGSLRPVILFPERMLTESTSEEQRYCLAHEWAHVQRRDIFTWHLITLSQPFLWCQPLFWHLRRELRVCQDLLADSATAAGGSADYAQLLLSLGKSNSALPAGAALGIGDQKSNLYRRITMLLDNTINTRTRCRPGVLAMAFAVFTVVALVASFVSLDSSHAARPDEVVNDDENNKTTKETKTVDDTKPEPLSYSGVVTDTDTGDAIEGARVTVRRMILTSSERRVIEESHHTTGAQGRYSFVIPLEQRAERSLYIELDVQHDDYASETGFGYALSMILKNEKLGERPFFENLDLHPAQQITGTLVSPEGRPVGGVKLLAYSKQDAKDFRDYGSFFRATSKVDGTFRLNVVKGGTSLFWIVPLDYTPQQIDTGTKRGDLGTIELEAGVRLTGQVLDANDEPIGGVWVNAENQDNPTDLNVVSSLRRSAMTDEQGRFTLGPVGSGKYKIGPERYPSDINLLVPGRAPTPLPAVFGSRTIAIDASAQQQPIRIQAVPHIFINAQYYDSKSEPCRGHAFLVSGRVDGQGFRTMARPDHSGRIACMVPQGLKDTKISLITNEHSALRYRMSKDERLKPGEDNMKIGTLSDDIAAMEIVRYIAPVALVKAVDENQQLLKDVKISAVYPWGARRFEQQNDGRHRSHQLLPDEDLTITATADGYEEASQAIKLIEGEEREFVLVLKKKA